jgi:hypothetical protein
MYMRRLPGSTVPRVLARLPVILGATALVTVLGYSTPAHSLASPACFKVCSNLFFKNISAVVKCTVKETVAPGTGVPCAMKAASKMVTNYDTKHQTMCGGSTCAISYGLTQGGAGCLALLTAGSPPFTTENEFGFGANPPDAVTNGDIAGVAPAGCAY